MTLSFQHRIKKIVDAGVLSEMESLRFGMDFNARYPDHEDRLRILESLIPVMEYFHIPGRKTSGNVGDVAGKRIPKCPKCEEELKLRYNRTRKNVFWGCPNYSTEKRCEHTAQVTVMATSNFVPPMITEVAQSVTTTHAKDQHKIKAQKNRLQRALGKMRKKAKYGFLSE